MFGAHIYNCLREQQHAADGILGQLPLANDIAHFQVESLTFCSHMWARDAVNNHTTIAMDVCNSGAILESLVQTCPCACAIHPSNTHHN
eukprot:3550029-Amphidinium_carterae.1